MTTMEVVLVKRWRLCHFRARLARLLAGMAVLGLLYWAMTPYAMLGWNATESLPGRVFLIVKVQKPQRGDMAAFYPPKNPYYPEQMFFTKILMGMPGDVVSHRGREVYLNTLKLGTSLDFDTSRRRKLDMVKDGTIPAGFHFVWTPHPHSYDSRYADIGLISDAQIIGRAYRLL